MIKGKNILCFGSEKWGYPGFQQTIMHKLSSANRILYINSLGTRKISLRCSQLSFYLRRALRFYQHNHNASTTTAVVCNPWVIPLMNSSIITKCNRQLLRIQFSRLLKKLNFKDYLLWIGTPAAASYLDLFKPTSMVYNPVDRYSAFPFVNKTKICEYEKQIAKKADLIICTSEAIKNDFLPLNNSAITFTHGVDFDFWNSAANSKLIPSDIKKVRKPIIGYFGSLSADVFDIELLKKVAVKYPQANIVLIGRKMNYLDQFEKNKNIYLLGYKDYKLLPSYLKHFDVCLIPFHVNELMEGVDPIKLREYLSLGKPVVSVALPEVAKVGRAVYVAENEKEFVNLVGKALEEEKTLFEERLNVARQSDWNVKLGELSNIINNYL
jgi:hypothetical protein